MHNTIISVMRNRNMRHRHRIEEAGAEESVIASPASTTGEETISG